MTVQEARHLFPQIAGHPALDLVDTVHWRLDTDRLIDTLASFDDVVEWCEQLGLLTEDPNRLRDMADADPDTAAREHSAALDLREAIYSAIFEGSQTAADVIAHEYIGALTRSRLVNDDDRGTWSWRVPTDLTGLRATIVIAAQELLASDLSHARQCADNACGWVYLDTSPRHNRMWCTASGCGNRNRVARHHAKKKT